MQLLKTIHSLINKQRGQSIIEYALILSIFASVFIYIGANAIDLIKGNYRTSMAPYSMTSEVPVPEGDILPPFEFEETIVAKISGNQYIKPHEPTTFKSVSSSSSDIIEYQWTVKRGNTILTTGTSSELLFSATDSASTNYTVTLYVKNADGQSDSTTVTLSLKQTAPVAVLKMNEGTETVNPNLTGTLSSIKNIKGYYAGDVIRASGGSSYDEDGDEIEKYNFKVTGVSGTLLGFSQELKANTTGSWALDTLFANKDGVIKVTLTVEDEFGAVSPEVVQYIAYNVEAGIFDSGTNNYHPEMTDIKVTVNGDEICFTNPSGKDKEDGNLSATTAFSAKQGSGSETALNTKSCYTTTTQQTYQIFVKDSKNAKSNPFYVQFIPSSTDIMISVGSGKIFEVSSDKFMLKAEFTLPRYFPNQATANTYSNDFGGEGSGGYQDLSNATGKETASLKFVHTDYALKFNRFYIYHSVAQEGSAALSSAKVEGYYMYRNK